MTLPSRRVDTKSVRAQPRQLLRHRRLAQVELVLQLAHRLLAFGENAKDDEPAFVRERFKEIAGAFGVVDHACEFVRAAT